MSRQLETECKRALADISINLAFLEENIMRCIMYIGNLNWRVTVCLLGSDQMDVLIAKLEKVVFYFIMDDAISKDFKPILKALHTINEARNTYIHSIWHFPGEPPPGIKRDKEMALRLKYKRRFSASDIIDLDLVDVQKLDSYAVSMQVTADDLTAFVNRNFDKLRQIAQKRNQGRGRQSFDLVQ